MMLEVHGLCAYYGQSQALHGLDFALAEGAVVTLLGANGAGKTTTLRALCGMVRMTGDIRFDGKPITGRATEDIVRLGIAHVPEGRGTFVRMSVEENLRLGATTRHDHAAIAADIDEIYALFPRLKERRGQQAGTLSGGEQQMLAVGRALMSRPRLLVIDEASLGLSPTLARTVWEATARIARDGTTVLMVEQNAGALPFADRALIMEKGTLVHTAVGEEIRNVNLREAYLGA